MKIAVYRLFEEARRAEGTVRELVLMQIPERDISVTALRDEEGRSFSSEHGRPRGLLVRADVDQADAPRVEATLVRNGGVEIRSPAQTGIAAGGFIDPMLPKRPVKAIPDGRVDWLMPPARGARLP